MKQKNTYTITFTYKITILDNTIGKFYHKYENMTVINIKAHNKNNAIVELVKNLDLETVKFYLSHDDNFKHLVNDIIKFEIMNILRIEKK